MVLLTANGQPNCRHLAEISKCIIHPSSRGRGLLSVGFQHVLARCRVRRIDVVTLDVRKGTRAEQLWLALGFRPFGELNDYARTDGKTHAGTYLYASVDDLMRRHMSAKNAAASGVSLA